MELASERRRRRTLLAVAGVGLLFAFAVFAWVAGGKLSQSSTPIVEPVPASERKEAMDRAADATRPSREAARKELETLDPRR